MKRDQAILDKAIEELRLRKLPVFLDMAFMAKLVSKKDGHWIGNEEVQNKATPTMREKITTPTPAPHEMAPITQGDS